MLERSEKDGIATIRLAHGKVNAMNIELCQAMIDTFHELRASPVKAVVLTGQGAIFSAGVDLLRTSDDGGAYVRTFLPVLNAMFAAVFHFPRPVVAAINGHAIAGGCVLACCADLRLMAQGEGRIGVTELLVGLPFPALAFEVMRLVTTPRYFPQAIYGGETFRADGGMERGWVNNAVSPAELMDRAIGAAQSLATLPMETFEMTKRQVHMPVTERLDLAGDAIDAAVTENWATPEATARIRDYVGRTLRKR